jgi:hypothetical protein
MWRIYYLYKTPGLCIIAPGHRVLFPSPNPFSIKVQLIHFGEGEPGPLVFVQTLSILHVLLQIRPLIMLSSVHETCAAHLRGRLSC